MEEEEYPQHLERHERHAAAEFINKGLSPAKVAKAINRGKSTVRREMDHGIIEGVYYPDVAHHKYLVRLYSSRLGKTQGAFPKDKKCKLPQYIIEKARIHRRRTWGRRRLEAIIQKYKDKGAEVDDEDVAQLLVEVNDEIYEHMVPSTLLDAKYLQKLRDIFQKFATVVARVNTWTQELFEVIEIQVSNEGLDGTFMPKALRMTHLRTVSKSEALQKQDNKKSSVEKLHKAGNTKRMESKESANTLKSSESSKKITSSSHASNPKNKAQAGKLQKNTSTKQGLAKMKSESRSPKVSQAMPKPPVKRGRPAQSPAKPKPSKVKEADEIMEF